MVKSRYLVFTGGHHSGALAVAQELIAGNWQIIWIGHRYSMQGDKSDSAEYQEVHAAGIKFIDLKAGKFHRVSNPWKLLRIPLGFIRALSILTRLKLRYKSDLKGIVSFGGYLAVPVVICGWLLGIPSITHEQTTVAGHANRLLSLFVKKIAVSWASGVAHYPHSKVVVTGLPLRPEIKAVRRHKSSPTKKFPTIFFLCGKQGSHLINQVVFSCLPQLLEKYRIIHQTGSASRYSDFRHAKALWRSLPQHLQQRYQPREYYFPDQIKRVFSHTDLLVGRSGAHQSYEIAYLGLPSILIPIPWGSHNEQYQNAKMLADAGLAIILPQHQLNVKTLLEYISRGLSMVPGSLPVPGNGLGKLVNLINQTFDS